MHRHGSSKRQTITRALLFVLMCLFIGGLLVVLVLYMLGYRFNRSEGKVEQGALVQFESQPSGATVNIDEMVPGSRTPSKITVSTGDHFITMRKPGYRQWQKSVSLTGGQLLWLNYARLVPENLTPRTVQSYPAVTSALASHDRRWIAAVTTADSLTLKLVDLSGDQTKQTDLALPAAVLSTPDEGKSQQFQIIDWSSDNTHLLVKHTFNDGVVEWLIVPRERPIETENITRTLGVRATQLAFSASSAAQLYALTDAAELRKIDVGAATLSGPLVDSVAEFTVFSDNVVGYTTKPDGQMQAVGYYQENTKQARQLKSVDSSQGVPRVVVGRYFDETYVAIAHGTVLEVMKGDLAKRDEAATTLKAVATVSLAAPVESLTLGYVKGAGRFVMAGSASSLTSYDIELAKTAVIPLPGATGPQWIDGTHFVDSSTGTATMYDFDGANKQPLMPTVNGLASSLSPNGKYFYGFNKSANETIELKRIQLNID